MSSSSNRDGIAVRPVGRRVIGPRLKVLFHIVLALVALIGANSVYLAGITCLEWISRGWGDGLTYQSRFYLIMFLVHLAAGLLLVVPFVLFGWLHMLAARRRYNRRAVTLGYALLAVGLLVLTTGILLIRIDGLVQLKSSTARALVYWLHVAMPLVAAWLYWLHRLAGARIGWRIGLGYSTVLGIVVVILIVVQMRDPRDWVAEAPKEGARYFQPSLARTQSGNLIPAKTLMMDTYCKTCHEDAHKQWSQSMHHLSSFNNPAYLATILETREVLMKRDGHVRAARWCAGCHDPVPFFSGAFDDPEYDFINDPTGKVGIGCTACHAITHVSSTRGNADYVIEQPIHYPFAFSDNRLLQWINHTLIKAKPSFHKQVFLKPALRTSEFCSTCHKVHLPWEITHYKQFLRGQNHYDNFLLSGVSGSGARSFYYPEKAEQNCNNCHMPLTESSDFGAQVFDARNVPTIHNHLFLGANTAVTWLHRLDEAVRANQAFLKETARVDLFGVRQGGAINNTLHAPLRPKVPPLKPGGTYLLEAVVRTLKMGHMFTQGTTDSNQVWLEVRVTSGNRLIGHSGWMDAKRQVDPWSHFINVFMLDRNGNRISRRNGQDIVVPLYDHQIPPGAAQTVHYRLHVPSDVTEPIRVALRLKYRKFDAEYMRFVGRMFEKYEPSGLHRLRGQLKGEPYLDWLPVTVMAEDVVFFPIAGSADRVSNPNCNIPAWQRWNDYAIGMFLKGKAELRQAAEAFQEVEKLGRYDGPLNLARVLYREGRLDEAVDALRRASKFRDPMAPSWTMAWLSGLVNREQGRLADAERDLRSVLRMNTSEMRKRGFNFSKDYEVINELGATLFFRAQQSTGRQRVEQRTRLLQMAIQQFQQTLELDSENGTAHYNLARIYGQLGKDSLAAKHRELHLRYKIDDNARDRAILLARKKYPAANHAAESLVIYDLNVPNGDDVRIPGRAANDGSESGGAE